MAAAFWFIAFPIIVYIIVHMFIPNEPIDQANREMIEEMKESWRQR